MGKADAAYPPHKAEAIHLTDEDRIILFRELDSVLPSDNAGELTGLAFNEWLELLGDISASESRNEVLRKIQALRANRQNYVSYLRPDVQEFIDLAEAHLRDQGRPVLLNLRDRLKKSLNGHAR